MHSHQLIETADPRFLIQIHGGAWAIPGSLKAAHQAGVRKAHEAALSALQAGEAPLRAVLAALKVICTLDLCMPVRPL